METEFEAKFYPVNKEEYRKKLDEVGAKLLHKERKLLRFNADHRGGSKVVFPKNSHIRVRDEGNLVRLSLKTVAEEDGKLTDQKELDVVVSDFDKTVAILEYIGVCFNYKVETLREEWELNGAVITIDTWPGLETYTEIEANSEEQVQKISTELGFDWEQRLITAAPEIFAKVYGLGIEKVLIKLNFITFENNPFEGLTKVWNGE